MGEKYIVLNMYGKGNAIENISISLFEGGDYYYSAQDIAFRYCKNINDLELKDDQWIHAAIVKENEKITLKVPLRFDIINNLDDKSLQKVLREINKRDLAIVLKNSDEETKEKVFRNMTKRSAAIVQEDMEVLHEHTDIKLAKNKIIETIQLLATSGEIIL